MKLLRRYLYQIVLKNLLLVFILFTLLGFLMAVGVHAVTTERSHLSFSSRQIIAQPDIQLQKGQALYQQGQYLEAANVWKDATSEFQSQGDILNQGLVLSYLALASEQLGQFQEAEATMNQAVALITNQTLPQSKFILAQILNNQGQLQFNQEKVETALETWKKAEKLYRELEDYTGEIGTQLNQARALQALGLYLRARTTLEQVDASLTSQSDSQLKLAGLLNLGKVLRVAGDFAASENILEQGLAVAQRLQSLGDIQVARLSLGSLAEAQEQTEMALQYYRQAAAENSPVRLQAQIHQLNLLVQLNRLQEAQNLLPLIQTQLANLPSSQTTIYAQIELAKSLVKLNPKEVTAAAQLLATAQQQAKLLGNLRAESYAVGRLGQLYLEGQQWEEAQRLTQEALHLTQTIHASEIAYQWQWQMGQLLLKTGDRKGAIAFYTDAVNTLQSLRQDLVSINQDVQFSFREQVEPVYRELVDLLLQPTHSPPYQGGAGGGNSTQGEAGEVSQANLQQARATIETLQLAELANFFREACLDTQPQDIDRIDPTAAVIYPIILRDRLEVILSLPSQSLRKYTTNLSQEQVEQAINRMRQSLRRTSFAQERLAIAQEIYSWLVQPAAEDLTRQSIKTLVFVLDGSLRNIPMAALHDGRQYLIEQYGIAIAPSLQLLTPQPLAQRQFKALLGGLSEGKQEFSPLPGVKQEVKEIGATVSGTVLLDQQFTNQALETQVKTQPYSIVHLATHGQFSSKPEETFILTWDGRLDVKQLNTLLTNRELSNSPPLELFVLSACQTAKGDQRAALGLAGVAVRSGARSTLGTLWTVNDESTADFMEQFYQELFTRKITKAEAVQLAQIHLLKQPESSHPYFWAPFILVGNWL
ncbi:MAG: CHAT domain-containing protein [Symploca sp. SIO2C1]|nr:CHAT domain-containing protein [Symploca sp. SIO2C1]